MAEEEKKETTPEEEKTNNKLNSRKFIVFIIGSLMCLSTLVFAFIKGEIELVKTSLESFLFIAGFYTGGNCFNKWVTSKTEGGAE